jgi:hypothetical protein
MTSLQQYAEGDEDPTRRSLVKNKVQQQPVPKARTGKIYFIIFEFDSNPYNKLISANYNAAYTPDYIADINIPEKA